MRLSSPRQTQDLDPMLFYCWSTVCDTGPILNHHWFNAEGRGVEPMLFYCRSTVCDAGPTLNQHWFNLQCFLVMGSSVSDEERNRAVDSSSTTMGSYPIKHETLTQFLFDSGPASPTLNQHWIKILCWEKTVNSQVIGIPPVDSSLVRLPIIASD